MLKLNRQLARIRQRDGISIIEVLTSMAVATIGVFGIMVMIPFAVRQSQRGLDNDAANALGRNAVEEMQIQGYFIADSTNNLERIDGFTGTPSVMHFDPIGGAELGTTATGDDVAGGITIDRVTGLNLEGNVLSAREASRLCRSSDDISHSDPDDTDTGGIDQLNPPQPIYDVDGTGTNIKRQFAGRLSWSMFLVPEKAAGTDGSTAAVIHRLRTFTLVYRDRLPALYSTVVDTDTGEDNIFDVVTPNGFLSPVSEIEVMGTFPDGLGKDSWIMLINTVPADDPSATPPQDFQPAVAPYNAQVMFAKVTRVNGTTVNVDGGPFYVHDDTQLVHLENVVNVFERSIAIED